MRRPGFQASEDPAVPARSLSSRMLGLKGTKPRFSESRTATLRDEMSALFGTLLPLIDEHGAMVLHVTAASPGEGTTTIARGLAAAAARREQCRVLLIDVEPSTALPSGLGAKAALEQMAESGEIVPTTRLIDGVGIPATTLMRSVTDAPKMPDLRALYDWTRQHFALTIVDCPPVLGTNETAAISRLADGILLVVNADDTRVAVVQRARDSLMSAGATILGVVLNRRQNFIPKPLYKFL